MRDLRSALRASGRLAVALAFCAVLAQGALGRAAARPSGANAAADDAARAPLAARGEAVAGARFTRYPIAPAEPPRPAVEAPLEPAWPGPAVEATAAPAPAWPTLPPATVPPATRPPATVPPPTATPAPPSPTATVRPTARPTIARPASGPLRGIGYNPVYAKDDASPEARAARLQRDLRLMAEVGVDMVLGWDPGVFDEALLDAAEANGIGVLMPFELRPEYNYAEPETRVQLTEAVLAWVDRYRARPGVLMWAIGNEVTLEMGDAERRAYADFYAELLPRVRAADPDRPVVLREAEDVFAPYLAEALARRGAERTATGAVAAPVGLVYGVNFYTDRLGSALEGWVDQTGLDAALLVSEYSPAGVGRAGRADRLARMHAEIAAVGRRVVGSAPYTWTTAGPEAVDAYFGLVDAEGRAVDGTAAALAQLYGVEPPGWAQVAGPVDERREDPAELSRLIEAAVQEAVRQGGQDADGVRAGVVAQTRAAAAEYGVSEREGSADGTWAVAQLIGWARALSTVRRQDERLFPGLHEALPLLDGMARWSAVESSADETARSFVASVLRRDLENAAAGGLRDEG